ncbi:7SK snRNA methylphosphate capping enzyme-like isoform X2 [Macrobrachium nipponense]|uniref:7SK snRNA methylphosphate capping enzyme-like isoform X2 n=1 Tax=Macrobrachium nipponense TaxID=159736 RepID=UPI0030C7F34D
MGLLSMSSELGVERPTTLPLADSQEERRVHFGNVSKCLITDERKHAAAFVRDPESRPKRLRSASFSAPGEARYGNKRRKRYRVLPSKFLLGGNITDPLNLGSLEDREDVSQLGLVEAGSGAINKKSDAVRVIIPPNINDPLNLDVSSENEDSLSVALLRQIRRRRRSRKRKRRLSEPSGDEYEPTHGELFVRCQSLQEERQPITPVLEEGLAKTSQETLKPLTVNIELPPPSGSEEDLRESGGPVTPVGTKPSTSGGFQRPAFKKQRNKSDNKIVSPVIPQPGVERKRHPSHSRQYLEKPHLSQQNLKLPKKFNPKNELFQYGNYNKYYGYRNPDMSPDLRLNYLKPDWFDGKAVLDVGCNIGHVTLTIARDFNPKRVVGLDIDKKLVNIAQKNIKHYLKQGDPKEADYPKSMRLLYGPLKPSATVDEARCFPHNIKFVHANYVLESDELLETVRPEFDVVICFSITKWIHLNWGDAGLKRFFRRIFYNLNPGGRLILEPQAWPSYNKRRKLTMRIFENYKNIRLFPDKFNDYLLHEVGFSTSEKMITPQHTSRGFQRPIIVYTKAGNITKSNYMEDSYPRNISTTPVSVPQQCHSSEMECDSVSIVNKHDAQEVSQKETDTAASTTNEFTNLSEKVNKDSADGPSMEDDKVAEKQENTQTMGHISNSLVHKEQRLVTKNESDVVCDSTDTSKTLGGEGDKHLTHSHNHRSNQCVPESHLPSQTDISIVSESCTKIEMLKQHTSPATRSDNKVKNKGCLNDCMPGSSDEKQKTSVKPEDSHGSNAVVMNKNEVNNEVCENSKGVDTTNHNGSSCATKPRSPNINETKDRP